MRKTTTLYVGIALGAMLSAPAMAQQTLTFTNSTPSVTVPLLGGSTVGITTNGNVVALCQLDTNNRCVGLPSTSSGTPPTVTLAASNFSAPINAGKYPVNTTFNLTPTVSNGDICVRRTTGSTPSGTGWTGTATSPFTATQVTLNTADSTFNFTMDCYGTGGMSTATTVTLQTSIAVIDPPTGTNQCTTPIAAPTGFTQQTNLLAWTDLRTVTGGSLGLFPNTGGALGQIAVQRARYVSIKFVADDDPNAYVGLSKAISWLELQQGGEANPNKTYVSVTQCPGDFRVPATGTAPLADPTLALGCRNLRPTGNLKQISYSVSGTNTASGNFSCALKYGNTYYFNVILASPYDGAGIEVGEHTCSIPTLNQCGIQVQAN